jgi:antitoxin MazE
VGKWESGKVSQAQQTGGERGMEKPDDPTITVRATIGPKGRVTIPRQVRERLRVGPGDEIVFQVSEGRAEVVPLAVVPRDQVWFYGDGMRERITKAEMDIVGGRTTRVSTPDALDEHLEGLEEGRK